MNYSRITPEAGMAMKKASGDNSPLWQVAGKSFYTSRTRVDDGGGLQYFSWMEAWDFRVFPMK
jgi:hypothetical protein